MTDESKELVEQAGEIVSMLEHIAIMAEMLGVTYPAPQKFVKIMAAGTGYAKKLLDEAVAKSDKAE